MFSQGAYELGFAMSGNIDNPEDRDWKRSLEI